MKAFILPDLGEGIVECEVVKWHVAPGEDFIVDQAIVDVMTDKATVEIPAAEAGILTQHCVPEGEIAKMHQPLFRYQLTSTDGGGESHTHEAAAADAENTASQQEEDFILPDIGEGIVECEIIKWCIQPGETVAEDQVVVEVMTDKAVVEIPAKHSGTVIKHYYQPGQVAPVHSPLFRLSYLQTQTQAMETLTSAPVQVTHKNQANVCSLTESATTPQGKALASPAVRRLAREAGIDIAAVVGSGDKGRVLKQDIQLYLDQGADNPINAISNANQQSCAESRVEPIRGIMAAMAKQMQHSVSTIPHFSVSDEISIAPLLMLQQQLQSAPELESQKLSLMPIYIKALSQALNRFPIFNSQVDDACRNIHYLPDHNIGFAVDTSHGLLVPNIKQVQRMSLAEVITAYNELVTKARTGKLSQADMQQGTITLSNIGVLGGTVSTPIIQPPQVAIVALGKARKVAVFDEHDQVKAQIQMPVSWSADHRIIDGATMMRFQNYWKSLIEQPASMLMHMR